jgi:hypothetical protein
MMTAVDQSMVSSALPLQFSLQSLREVGILPESILGQISRGLAHGEEDDVAALVKTSVLREEEAMKKRFEEEEEEEEDREEEEEDGEDSEEEMGVGDGEENGNDPVP